jgi:hypothetical protein
MLVLYIDPLSINSNYNYHYNTYNEKINDNILIVTARITIRTQEFPQEPKTAERKKNMWLQFLKVTIQ